MSVPKKDVYDMDKTELSALLSESRIQHDHVEDVDDMRKLYMKHMNETCSESGESELQMAFQQKDVYDMDKTELSALLSESRIQHDHVEDVDDMRELYMKHMNETCSDSGESEMSFQQKDVYAMDKTELSALLTQSRIQHDHVKDVDDMQELYLKHMNDTCSVSEEMTTGNRPTMEEVEQMDVIEISDLLVHSNIQFEDVETLEEMKYLYYKNVNPSGSSQQEDPLMTTGNRPSMEEVEQMDVIEISDLLEQSNIQFEDVETLEEMKYLYYKHVNPSGSSQQEDPLMTTGNRPSMEEVEQMDVIEISDLLEQSNIQFEDVETLEEMKYLYYKHVNPSGSSQQEDPLMTTGNRPSMEEVEQMDVIEISDLLEHSNIQFEDVETLEEMKYLYYKHVNPSGSSQQEDPLNSVMEEVIENDQMKREKMKEIYNMLIKFLRHKREDLEKIESISEIIDENFVGSTLVANKEKLSDNECPIVIAGETSAGKSTLLNLLLGTNILPHSLLGTTAAICHLHNCKNRRFEILSDKDGPIKVKADSDEEMRKKLKPYITAREVETKPKFRRVDVYWPIAMIHENMTIIDTPGIGENDHLTELLLTYLPNAVAFIYVINTNNSGGIQEDYLLKILTKQAEWAMNDLHVPNAIDYESTLFVCNKWDKIKPEEENDVWKYITNRITKLLPYFPQEHILKMSATLAQRYRKNGLGLTSDFATFLKGFEKLIAGSMAGKRRKYCMPIRSVLQKLHFTLSSRINAERGKYDKEIRRKDVLASLCTIRENNEKVKSELLRIAEQECLDISRELRQYFQDNSVIQRILRWEDQDLTDLQFDDRKETKQMAEKKIQSRINDEINGWEERNHFVKKAIGKMREKFISQSVLLNAECEKIEMVILGSDEIAVKKITSNAENSKMPTEYKVAAAVTAPIWLPLSVAAAIFVLPVAIGMTVSEHITESSQQADLKKNIGQHMTSWAKIAVESSFTEANIKRSVNRAYLSAFKKEIDKICTHFIPEQIKKDKQLIENICDDTRKSEEKIDQFQPLLEEVERIQGVLDEFADLK